jgi:hypothetical protein
MADFETRVEAITGITVGTNPTTAELTQYLVDGVLDVTNRTIALKPQDVEHFVRGSSASASNGALSTDSGKLISVMRESGTASDWRECRKIPFALQSRVTDKASLHYSSKFNPSFIQSEDGAVLVYPAPGNSPDTYKIYYINGSPVNTSDASLIFSHSDIKYFPEDKVYLVVLYAGIKSLQNALAAKSDVLEAARLVPNVPALPAAPDVIAVPSFTSLTMDEVFVSNLGAPPTFTAPKVAGATEELTAAITAGTAGTDADQQDFSDWWEVLGDLIEDEEDLDLAQAQLGKIQAYVQAYAAQLQTNQAKFSEEAAEYQAKLQEALKKADLDAAKAAADENYTQQKEFTDYASKVQKYQNDIANYSAEVGVVVGKFSAEVQSVTVDMQQYQLEYGWVLERIAKLQQEYDTAFVVLGGPREEKG